MGKGINWNNLGEIMVMEKPPKQKRRLTKADKEYVASKQNWKCANPRCRVLLKAGCYDVDHKQSIEQGGSDSLSNLQALCAKCHREKHVEERMRLKQKRIKESQKPDRRGFFDFGKTDVFLNPRESSVREKRPKTTPRKKKKRGFFDFGDKDIFLNPRK